MTRVLGLALFLGTVAVFWPLGDAGFVNYDDPGYVYENPNVVAGLSVDGVRWAFTTFHKANYHPVTWLSHMGDVDLFGLNPGAHHLVNVALHALSAVLLFAFLVRATGAPAPSVFAAGLFALHPLHVESVAWISERKDVLATLFWLLAMHGYLSWARFGGGLRYVGVALLLVLGLLSKPVVVTLPCVFLLLDVWPLRRVSWTRDPTRPGAPESIGRLVWEKVPMFALVALASAATFAAQDAGGAVVGTPDLPPGTRLASSILAYLWYLEKTVWPAGLAVMYPHPHLGAGTAPGLVDWGVPLAFLAALTAVLVQQVKARPYLLIGWLWFLGTLVPMIGLVQVGAQATADRYTYVPLIGPFVAVAFLGAEVFAGSAVRRRVGWVVAGVVLLACASLTRAQLVHWQDASALARRSVSVTRDNYVMHFNLGLALQTEGDLAGAREHYERAIAIEPGRAGFHGNLATVLVALGKPGAAVERYQAAIALEPREPSHQNNLAWLLATHPDAAVRRGPEALRLAQRAVRQAARADPQLLDTLAAAQAEVGRWDDAVATARIAVQAAEKAGNPALAATIAARARSYAAGRPHRESPAPAR